MASAQLGNRTQARTPSARKCCRQIPIAPPPSRWPASLTRQMARYAGRGLSLRKRPSWLPCRLPPAIWRSLVYLRQVLHPEAFGEASRGCIQRVAICGGDGYSVHDDKENTNMHADAGRKDETGPATAIYTARAHARACALRLPHGPSGKCSPRALPSPALSRP